MSQATKYITQTTAKRNTRSTTWPCWHDSTTRPIRWAPMSRKDRAFIWHKARAWDRDTKKTNRHGGVIGRTALHVLYSLLHDFMSIKTGRLDPSVTTIAKAASLSPRAVHTALKRLRTLGLIDWQRRCEGATTETGRWILRQMTNAYVVLLPARLKPPSSDSPPPPGRDELGLTCPILTPQEVATKAAEDKDLPKLLSALRDDPASPLARAILACYQSP